MNSSEIHELKELVLRDIEPILKQKLGNEVIVENFTTELLLPPGENYGSTIMSVHVKLRKNNDAEEEDLNLIAKMLPPTEYQRRIFNSFNTFCREIFMYDCIMQAYNQLEIECGVNPNDIFDITAKYYGSRLSLQPDVGFDDDAVILMENLKVRGYYMDNRLIGHDLEHAEVAIKALARFHALGIAMKQKKPETFKRIKLQAAPFKVEDEAFDLFAKLKNVIKNDSEIGIYYDRCGKIFTKATSNVFLETNREPWTTIVHFDFWVNNIMFHRNEQSQIDDIKFVDFQLYQFGSPVRDLLLYLFSSLRLETTYEELENLMDLYYETLMDTLNKMDCDTSKFSKHDFKVKMSEDATREFFHIFMLAKVITLKTKEVNFNYDQMEQVIMDYPGNDLFIARIRKIVKCYIQNNWI